VSLCLASRETWDREIAHREDNQNAWACVCGASACYPAFNQKSKIINQQFTSGLRIRPFKRD